MQDLVNLKVINLFDSENLVRISDLSSATNLEKIDLSGCSNLLELPSSLQHLEKLTNLNVSNCQNLRSLPSFYKATSLTRLYLIGCSNLFSFPEVSSNVTEPFLVRTAIEEVPSSIECLSNHCDFNLWGCRRLKSLPTSIHKLKSLESFNLNGCSRLETFPEILDTMERLSDPDLSETALKELPSSIDNLVGLEYLRLKDCENLVCLPDSLYKLKSLKKFKLKGCSRLKIFPEILDTMERMRNLDLSGTALKGLPSSIDNLIGLEELRLKNCGNLVCLPDSLYKLKSLNKFKLKGCSKLENFLEILDTMERLRNLDLSGTALKELPFSIDNLIDLESLGLRGSSNLEVKNLFIAIGGRPVKQKHLHGLSSLKKLDLSESNLENLPTTIKQFPLLEELILGKCKRLKSLPELPPSLEYLDAHDCTSLEDVSSIKKLFEHALFCQDINADKGPSLQLMFTNCFKLGEKGVGNDIDVDDTTSVEEVSSIKKLLKQTVFCKSLGWLFTNCFLLDQKAVSSPETPKLEMPFEHMVTILKDYHHQAPPECKRRPRIVTWVPGSEIPDWFDFKSLGSSINIPLPSEWWSNNSWMKFPCYVASVVVSFPDSSYNDLPYSSWDRCGRIQGQTVRGSSIIWKLRIQCMMLQPHFLISSLLNFKP